MRYSALNRKKITFAKCLQTVLNLKMYPLPRIFKPYHKRNLTRIFKPYHKRNDRRKFPEKQEWPIPHEKNHAASLVKNDQLSNQTFFSKLTRKISQLAQGEETRRQARKQISPLRQICCSLAPQLSSILGQKQQKEQQPKSCQEGTRTHRSENT